MKDPANEIIQAEFDVLDGNVSYASTTIPVYTQPVDWEDLPADQFIHIGEVDWEEDSPKDVNVVEGTIQIDVWTIFKGKNEGSKIPLDNISSQVLQIIDTELGLVNFTWVRESIQGINGQEGRLTSGEKVFGKEITVSFTLEGGAGSPPGTAPAEATQYDYYTDGTDNMRIGVRDGESVKDHALTPLGFNGSEGTDWEQVEGDAF